MRLCEINSVLTFGLSGEGHVVIDSLPPGHGHDGDGVVVQSLVPVDVGGDRARRGEFVAVFGVLARLAQTFNNDRI